MRAKRKAAAGQLLDFAASFYTDLELDGMLCAALVRSPVSRGRIKSLTHPNLPDGYFLLTAQDIPGDKTVSVLGTEIPVFAHDEVSYAGEPVGMVVGPDVVRLQRVLDEVVIRFRRDDSDSAGTAAAGTSDARPPEASSAGPGVEEAPPAEGGAASGQVPSGPADDADEGAPVLQDDLSGSILARKVVSGGGDAEAIFAEADIRVEETYSSVINPEVCSEPAGGLAVFEQDTLTLYSPVQWFSQVRRAVSQVLGIDGRQVEIRRTLSAGGNAPNMWYSVVVMAQLALAAKVCGRPVKLAFSRDEQRFYAERGVPVAVSHRTAVRPDGRIQAMLVSIVLDAGFHNPFAREIADRLAITAPGIYSPDSYKFEAYVVRSPSAPAAVNLSRIDSQVFFAVENQMQRLSRATGILPHELRLLNFAGGNGGPFRFNLRNMEQIVGTVARISDFSRKHAAYKLDCENRAAADSLPFSIPVRGIGMACAFEGCGFVGSDYYTSSLSLRVTMEKDGSVAIRSYPPSASVRAIWVRVVSSMLEIPAESVRIDSDFDIGSEPKYPNGFFGSIGVMTQLLRKCCAAIQRQRFRHPLPISVSRGITPQQKKQWDSAAFRGTPFFSTASGAIVAEVELDPCTFRTDLRGIWVVIDGGEVIAPRQAMATVKSEVRLLLSALVEDDILDCGRLEVQFVKSTDEPKQIGDLVHNLLPAAFTAAVSQAFGRTVQKIPVRQDSVCQPVTGASRNARSGPGQEVSE